MDDRYISAMHIDNVAPLSCHLQSCSPPIGTGIAGIVFLRYEIAIINNDGDFSQFLKFFFWNCSGFKWPCRTFYRSWDLSFWKNKTTSWFIRHDCFDIFIFMAVIQPIPPECECETRTAGPILVNSADAASVVTFISMGPMFGTICLKY